MSDSARKKYASKKDAREHKDIFAELIFVKLGRIIKFKFRKINLKLAIRENIIRKI